MRPIEAYRHARLNLEELVNAANELLPNLLPNDIADQRLKEELTPRLVRHYSSQGSLEEPQKEGREARYTYRHLLQLLALRRLQAEGHRTGAVGSLTSGMSEGDLESFLAGHAPVSLAQASNPALDFLQGLRASDAVNNPSAAASTSAPSPKQTRWMHYKFAPGLVLRVREDFRAPTDTASLLRQIEKALRQGYRRS